MLYSLYKINSWVGKMILWLPNKNLRSRKMILRVRKFIFGMGKIILRLPKLILG
jgi:hypothetical protein